MREPEQIARAAIDDLLRAASWQVCGVADANIHAARGVAIREFPLNPGHGFADYLLYVDGKAAGRHRSEEAGRDAHRRRDPVGQVHRRACRRRCPPGRARCPFAYESTGVETRFTNGLDPEPRSRRRLRVPPAGDAGRVAEAHCRRRPRSRPESAQARPTPQFATRPHVPRPRPRDADLVTSWDEHEPLARPDHRHPATWRRSLAANRPRALIQMATGSGKTFTAISFIYRLIKFAGARRVLFLVDRGNLGRQTLKEFQQYVSPVQQLQVHRGVQRPAPDRATRSTPAARVCITTIQRLYSMLKGRELARKTWTKPPARRSTACSRQPEPVDYNPSHPDRDLRLHRHRRVPPLDLQPLAAGAGVLRRLPDRPHRHAQQADLRLLQPEPGDGVRPRAGRGRRRQRRLRRLPHPHRRSPRRAPRSKPASSWTSATSSRARCAGSSSTTTSPTTPTSSTATWSPWTRSARSSAPSATSCSPRSSPAAPRCPRR